MRVRPKKNVGALLMMSYIFHSTFTTRIGNRCFFDQSRYLRAVSQQKKKQGLITDGSSHKWRGRRRARDVRERERERERERACSNSSTTPKRCPVPTIVEGALRRCPAPQSAAAQRRERGSADQAPPLSSLESRNLSSFNKASSWNRQATAAIAGAHFASQRQQAPSDPVEQDAVEHLVDMCSLMQPEDAVVVFARSCGSVCNKPPPTHVNIITPLLQEYKSNAGKVVHGAGGAPRQAQVLVAGRGAPAGPHSCRQECIPIPACRNGNPFLPAVCLTPGLAGGRRRRHGHHLTPCPKEKAMRFLKTLNIKEVYRYLDSLHDRCHCGRCSAAVRIPDVLDKDRIDGH